MPAVCSGALHCTCSAPPPPPHPPLLQAKQEEEARRAAEETKRREEARLKRDQEAAQRRWAWWLGERVTCQRAQRQRCQVAAASVWEPNT